MPTQNHGLQIAPVAIDRESFQLKVHSVRGIHAEGSPISISRSGGHAVPVQSAKVRLAHYVWDEAFRQDYGPALWTLKNFARVR